jgi:hypothetical protein
MRSLALLPDLVDHPPAPPCGQTDPLEADEDLRLTVAEALAELQLPWAEAE